MLQNTKRRVIYFSTFLAVLFLGIILINAITDKTKEWHASDNIAVSVSGSQVTLQEAIDLGLFQGGRKTVSTITFSGYKGHSFDEIWVSVNGDERTFQDAIQNTNLCGTSSSTTTYAQDPDPGHLASEIEVVSNGQTKSLQDAIDEGDLARIDGGWSDWSYGPCSLTQTKIRTRTCTNPIPFCGGADCSALDGGLNTEEVQDLTCPKYLVNGVHTEVECLAGNGELFDSQTGISMTKKYVFQLSGSKWGFLPYPNCACDVSNSVDCSLRNISTETEGTFCVDVTRRFLSAYYYDVHQVQLLQFNNVMCKFPGSSCPSPSWSQYKDWSTTTRVTGAYIDSCENDQMGYVASGYHDFSNKPVESVTIIQSRSHSIDTFGTGVCSYVVSESYDDTDTEIGPVIIRDYYSYYSADGRFPRKFNQEGVMSCDATRQSCYTASGYAPNAYILGSPSGYGCESGYDYRYANGGCLFGAGSGYKSGVTSSVHTDYEAHKGSQDTGQITYTKYATQTGIGCF